MRLDRLSAFPVTAFDADGELDPGLSGNRLFAALPAVEAGHVAYFGGAPVINSNSVAGQFSSAFSIGGPLGIKYALTELVPLLRAALRGWATTDFRLVSRRRPVTSVSRVAEGAEGASGRHYLRRWDEEERRMSGDTRTVIGHSAVDKLVLFGGLPLVGVVVGFFLPRIADWAAGRPWLPLQGPLELISRWDGWWVMVGGTALGLVAGVLLAGAALDDTLKVTIANDGVEFVKNQRTTWVPRDQVAVAFLDGKEIVLQDHDSRELARERHDQLKSEVPRIPAAFRAYGYPWSDAGDPSADRFRRWVEDDPDLPGAVNAVLRARAKAFDAGDKGKADLRELREEIAKLGYVVRDRDKNQYWRPIAR